MSEYANGMFERQVAMETWLGEKLTTAEHLFASDVQLDNPQVSRRSMVVMLGAFRKGYEAGYEEGRITFEEPS